jgi:2-iminobutanoate/2-iminopropanoate deaminase
MKSFQHGETVVKSLARIATGALTLLIAHSAGAAEITRHGGANALIHEAVVIPPGSETLLLSGLVPTPITPGKTDSFEAFGNTKTQTIAVMERIKGALKARGYAMSDVVKLTVFLVGDPALGGKMDFAGMNEAYRMYFGSADNKNLVTRSTIQVAALAAPYYLVEIEATAAKAPK